MFNKLRELGFQVNCQNIGGYVQSASDTDVGRVANFSILILMKIVGN